MRLLLGLGGGLTLGALAGIVVSLVMGNGDAMSVIYAGTVFYVVWGIAVAGSVLSRTPRTVVRWLNHGHLALGVCLLLLGGARFAAGGSCPQGLVASFPLACDSQSMFWLAVATVGGMIAVLCLVVSQRAARKKRLFG